MVNVVGGMNRKTARKGVFKLLGATVTGPASYTIGGFNHSCGPYIANVKVATGFIGEGYIFEAVSAGHSGVNAKFKAYYGRYTAAASGGTLQEVASAADLSSISGDTIVMGE